MTKYEQEFKQLLREIGEGSEDAARKFLDQYGDYILRVIRRRLDKRLRSKFDSEDFLQDVWVSFFHNPPPPEAFAQPNAMINYLATMAHNKVVGTARQRLTRPRYNVERENSLEGSAWLEAEHLHGAGPTASEAAMAKEQWLDLVKASSPEEEDILRLLRLGHTHEEIALKLNVQVKQVQRRLRRLRARLQA